MAAEFGRSLLAADFAWVTEVYGSREAPIAGVTGEEVVLEARASGHQRVRFVPSWRELPEALAESVAAGDIILTLGAGDIYRLGEQLVGKVGA